MGERSAAADENRERRAGELGLKRGFNST